MKSHTIGRETFPVFSSEETGGVWQVQFIWGKKDFRIYISRQSASEGGKSGPVLRTEDGGSLTVTRLEYLNAFEWYTYQGVAGHGLDKEETTWALGAKKRYVELPKGFFDIAVEVACREFGLTRMDKQMAS